MSKEDIEIKISTTANTSGAVQAEEALEKVAEAAQKATSDEGFGPLLSGGKEAAPFTDLIDQAPLASESIKEVGQSAGASMEAIAESVEKVNETLAENQEEFKKSSEAASETAESVRKIERAGRVLLALNVAQDLVKTLKEANDEGKLVSENLRGTTSNALAAAGSSLNIFASGIDTFLSTGNVAAAFLASLATGYKETTAAYDDMAEAQKKLANAPKEYAAQLDFARRQQRALAEEIKREEILNVLKKETEELEKQGRAIQRNNNLRNALNNAQVTQAQAELDIAQSTGGDVPLAKTNLLSVQLSAKVQEIDGKLTEAAKAIDIANQKAAESVANAEEAKTKYGEGDERFAEALNISDQALADAYETAQDSNAIIQGMQAERSALLTTFQAQFTQLETEIPKVASPATEKALNAFNTQLATEYQKITTALPDISSQAATPVVQAVQEISTKIDGERTATAAAVKAIPVPTQNTAAVQAAAEKMNETLSTMSQGIVAAFAQTTSLCGQIIQKIQGISDRQNSIEQQVKSIR
jgi:hypothetical protein